jgi:phospholipid/cholesterol/gamma-HCH transport system substrate-binding protein
LVKIDITRLLAGVTAVGVIAVIVAICAGMFRGDFVRSAPLIVIAERAGLVTNADAKVQLLGVQIGRVSSIDALPDGRAALHLAVDPALLRDIPTNVTVNIASSTVFGAKNIQLVPPPDPSPQRLIPGQTLEATDVTVEFNTMFDKLSGLLSKIEPGQLNQTLGAMSTALSGRGKGLGNALAAFDDMLTTLDPSLNNLERELQLAPDVIGAYADASNDLIAVMANASRISKTVVDSSSDLDAMLTSVIGLSDAGNEVLGSNRTGLENTLHLLVPTTDLTSQYNKGLNCALGGLAEIQKTTPLPEPGALLSIGFTGARERYRFPENLPKVAATGGPVCNGLPKIPFGSSPPFVVTDTGTNLAETGQQGATTLNSDALKQMLFGPLDGPPRNSAQIGQPG